MSNEQDDTTPLLEDEGSCGKTPVAYVSNRTSHLLVFALVMTNTLSYMDRFTVAGVLDDVQDFFGLDSSQDGLIQTVFDLFFVAFLPLFGYLGDRYTRKYIMSAGIVFWSGANFTGSFMHKHQYLAFLVFRAMVGAGQASFASVSPAIISDLFADDKRSMMLILFNVATPLGSGLGYIVGSNVAKLLGGWQWALRVTPVIGVLCTTLILTLPEPRRGMAEGSEGKTLKNTTLLKDLKTIFKNKSFMLSTIANTFVSFVTGTLALWMPIFMLDSIKFQGRQAQESSVSLTFGILTVIAGFSGVAIGGETARRYRKINPRADPIVCATGLILAMPFIFAAFQFSQSNTILAWITIFIGEILIFSNWSIVYDILLYVVVPTRRALASGVQILITSLADAGSPYLTGLVSDTLAKRYDQPATTPSVQFLTLRSALYMTLFACVLGGAFFLANALYIEQDRESARRAAQEMFRNKCREKEGSAISDTENVSRDSIHIVN